MPRSYPIPAPPGHHRVAGPFARPASTLGGRPGLPTIQVGQGDDGVHQRPVAVLLGPPEVLASRVGLVRLERVEPVVAVSLGLPVIIGRGGPPGWLVAIAAGIGPPFFSWGLDGLPRDADHPLPAHDPLGLSAIPEGSGEFRVESEGLVIVLEGDFVFALLDPVGIALPGHLPQRIVRRSSSRRRKLSAMPSFIPVPSAASRASGEG